MNRKSLVVLLVFVLMLSLSGCISINVKDVEIGTDAGTDEDWDNLAERFDILKYVPELADEVDYFCLKEGDVKDCEGVEIGFKEVRKPEKVVDEIIEMLEDEGYEYIDDKCKTNWAGTPKGQMKKDDYHCFNYSIKVNEKEYSSVEIFIECFDNKYPNSHNVFLRIMPEE